MPELISAEEIRHWAARGMKFGAYSKTDPHLTQLSDEELHGSLPGLATDFRTIWENPKSL